MTQWEAPTGASASAPSAPSAAASAPVSTASPFFGGGGAGGAPAIRVQAPACCLPPPHEAATVSPVVSAWKSHWNLMMKIAVALALVAVALAGSSLSGTQSIGAYSDNSWSDSSTVVLSPNESDNKAYYSVRLSGSATGGSLSCKTASQTSSSSPFSAASDCSTDNRLFNTSPFTGSGSSWLTKVLDGACLMTTSNKNGKTCSAFSGLAGVGIFVYILVSCALVCLALALAGMIEAHVVARQLADKKDGGDGGAAILTSASRPARHTWALLFVSLLLVVFAVISWAIVVTAALGSFKDAIIANDYASSGNKLPDGYTAYILFRPGSSWYILIVAIVAITTALRQVTIHKGAIFRTAQ